MVVLFFSHLLRALPQPVLAAVVLVAVAGLFKLSTLKQLWRGDRPEFVVAMAALLGVLGSGLLRGVMIGAIISLVQLLRRASQAARRLPRAHPRHAAFFGSRAASGQRTDSRRADLPARIGPDLFQCGPRAATRSLDRVRGEAAAAKAGRARPVRAPRRGPAKRAQRWRAWRTNSPPRASAFRWSRRVHPCATGCAREGVDQKLGGVNRFQFRGGRDRQPATVLIFRVGDRDGECPGEQNSDLIARIDIGEVDVRTELSPFHFRHPFLQDDLAIRQIDVYNFGAEAHGIQPSWRSAWSLTAPGQLQRWCRSQAAPRFL